VKTVVQYIRFFFYNAINWNIWLAFFVLYHDIRGGIKYRVRTFSPVALKHLTIQNADISKSSPYEAVNYYMLEKLLNAFRKFSDSCSIVDLGCGKGRVMVVAAYFGFTRITGIDFAKELCKEAIVNMNKTELHIRGINWQVINSDVIDYAIQPDDAVFFMFNPFVEETLNIFLNKLEKSCSLFPRKCFFIYASPQHANALEKRGYKLIYTHRIMNLRGMIFSKDSV
jgi:SAM-dependent methyltransferase